MSWRILPAIGIPGTRIAPVFRPLNEDRTDRTPRGKRPAEALRGHRAGRVLPHRRAGPPGTRCRAVRQRRLRNLRRAGAVQPAVAAACRGARPLALPPAAARARAAAGRRVRHPALPLRLSAFSARASDRPACGDDHARPARPDRLSAAVLRVPRHAFGVDLGRAAAAVACELGRHRLSRAAARSVRLFAQQVRWLPGVPRTDLSREAAGPRDRDCQADQSPAQDRCKG